MAIANSERCRIAGGQEIDLEGKMNRTSSPSACSFPTDFSDRAGPAGHQRNGNNIAPRAAIARMTAPVLAIRYMGGRHTQNHAGFSKDTKRSSIRKPGEFRNPLARFSNSKLRFSTNASGRVKAWLGEKQLVDFTGITANPENAATSYPSPSRFYFKMGLYRNVMPQPMTSYIDEYRKKTVAAE